jgi:hypothetical protein
MEWNHAELDDMKQQKLNAYKLARQIPPFRTIYYNLKKQQQLT